MTDRHGTPAVVGVAAGWGTGAVPWGRVRRRGWETRMARASKKTTRGSGRRSGGKARASADSSHPSATLLRARRVGLVTVVLAFGAGIWIAGWLLELDRIVVSRFEGRRFSIPSRVYAAPIVIYPGVDWQRLDLAGWLARMGYREQSEAGPLVVGSYRWLPGRLRVHLRGFDHPQLPETDRKVELRLEGGRVRQIRDDRGVPIDIVSTGPGREQTIIRQHPFG